MANKEDVLSGLELLYENLHKHQKNRKGFEDVGNRNKGAVAVILYLLEKGEAKSVDVSKALNISSARMAVLLKKLESKNMVVKTNSKIDARAIIIKLTDKGSNTAQSIKNEMYNAVEKVIDEVGLEELKKIIDGINKVGKILFENRPSQLEDLYV